MIDEELYQRATDELNSDRRRAHLWARACALSSDDHDEARYLYTNLRVEELIAERERGGPSPGLVATEDASGPLELEPLATATPASDSADPFASYEPDERLDDTEPDTELAEAIAAVYDGPPVAPLGSASAGTDAAPASAELGPHAASASPAGNDAEDGARNGDELSVASHGDGVAEGAGADDTWSDTIVSNAPDAPDASDGPDGPNAPDASAAHAGASTEAFGTSTAPARPESVRGTMRLELDENEVDLDADEIMRLNEAEPARRSPIAKVPSSGGFDPEATQRLHVGGRPHAGQVPEPPTLRAAPSAGGADADGADAERVRLHDVDDQLDEIMDGSGGVGGDAAANRAPGPRVRSDYADARDLDSLLEGGPGAARAAIADEDGGIDIVEDDSGRGRRWSVYEDDDGALQAVKRGVCWPALVVTLPWLLVRGLVGTAIVYALLLLASLGGAAVTGAAWLDAGEAVDGLTVLAFAGFVAIAVVGLLLVPWLRANRWRARRLLNKGWELAGELRAPSASLAVDRFRELDSAAP